MNSGTRTTLVRLAACIALAASAMSPVSPVNAQQPSKAAAAQASVEGEIFIVLASQGSGGIAPELRALDGLREAPFSTFSEMRLLERASFTLAEGRPVERRLPNGRTMRIELLGRNAEQRYRIGVSIQRPGSNDYLPLLTVLAAPGDPFFVAGQRFEGGTLVIGVRAGRH